MSLLDEYLNGWRDKKFDWPSANCCHFAGGWVLSAEGWDPMESFGPFESKDQIGIAIAKYGSLGVAITSVMRRPIMPSLLAAVGDIVLLQGEPNGSVGICNGRRAFFMSDVSGLAMVSMSMATAAWRVGAER